MDNLKGTFLLIILSTESKDEVLKRDKATKELSESLYIIVVVVIVVSVITSVSVVVGGLGGVNVIILLCKKLTTIVDIQLFHWIIQIQCGNCC